MTEYETNWGAVIVLVAMLVLAMVYVASNSNSNTKGQDADPCAQNDDISKRLCDQHAIEKMVILVEDFHKCNIIDHQAMEGMDKGDMMAMQETKKMLEVHITNSTTVSCANVINWYQTQNWTIVPENTTKVFLVK